MADIDSKTCTAVTLLFEGYEHEKAAHDFIIQFADGGLDQGLEERFQNIDRTLDLDTSDFDVKAKTITLRFNAPEKS